MDEDLKKAIEGMTIDEMAAFILIVVCKDKKDTDVIEVISECVYIVEFINKNFKGMATQLYKVLEIIIKKLEYVSDDGGYLEIELYQKYVR